MSERRLLPIFFLVVPVCRTSGKTGTRYPRDPAENHGGVSRLLDPGLRWDDRFLMLDIAENQGF
ncbi:hypothetical protein Q669_00815 [Labrenzia sp. C1B10]|nr:hypothetical protein Q669_00815 [Labrenzia sp. C1B10]ERS00900.1 hypothetical protein Q675_08830 [Labrenzia sp. C1B70]